MIENFTISAINEATLPPIINRSHYDFLEGARNVDAVGRPYFADWARRKSEAYIKEAEGAESIGDKAKKLVCTHHAKRYEAVAGCLTGKNHLYHTTIATLGEVSPFELNKEISDIELRELNLMHVTASVQRQMSEYPATHVEALQDAIYFIGTIPGFHDTIDRIPEFIGELSGAFEELKNNL